MPDLSQMETFVLTAGLGSLAAAARKLNISPAAVSKQLTRLEEELGVQLLVRSTRKITLTDVGNVYCVQCKRVLEEAECAADVISQVKTTPHGALRIVSGRHFANTYIVPHIKEFLSKHPHIELHLELSERIPDLHAESIDLLIGMSISAAGDAIQKRIATTSYVFCASPVYLKQFGVPKKPEDLKNHRYITHSMRRPDNQLTFNHKESIHLAPYIYVNDAQTMLQFALDGLGIVKLHRYVVQDALKKGQLKELLASYSAVDVPIYVAYPPRRFIPLKVRSFVDFIIEKM